jgi:RNA polymerase sigma-70 factor (ECF subfamily)
VSGLDDIEYVRLVCGGDTEAFGHIVRRYRRMVFTTVAKIVDSRHDAEDITQEIFIKVFRSLNRFRGQSEFSTWLYRIAYNTTISEVRRRRRDFVSLDERLPEAEIEEGIDHISTEERAAMLEQVLKMLNPEDAQIVMLYYFDGRSVKEISGISGLGESNVKVRLHRIRNFMNAEINKLLDDGKKG